jgi:hypothetical protein
MSEIKNQKKRFLAFGIISLVVGIVMILIMIYAFSISILMSVDSGPGYDPGDAAVAAIFFITYTGLLCGIVGLKSKKIIAIPGIVLSTLCLIPYILYLPNLLK